MKFTDHRLLCAALLTFATLAALPAGAGDFGSYWYQGKAEITSYDLQQARYGGIHAGHAVTIFVTEDFSRQKHVKLDDPGAAGDDAVKVLKLNATRNFLTGIYPYSMMTSVFTPVAGDERALKVTTSSQEWCGHTFTQLNRTDGGYRLEERSYFESEGDRTLTLSGAIAEDEIWTTIRLAPERLPTGPVKMIPGSVYQRMSHQPWRVHDAVATLDEVQGGLMLYTIEYPDLDRTLAITFREAFPHEIEEWQETARGMTTRAVKKERILSDYWRRNGVDDRGLRVELGLGTD